MLHDYELILQNETVLSQSYHTAILHGFPVALWRFPRTSQCHAMVDLSGGSQRAPARFSHLATGFIMAPFHNRTETASYFIQAHLYLQGDTCYFGPASSEKKTRVRENRRRFEKTLYKLCAGNPPVVTPEPYWFRGTSYNPGGTIMTKAAYCRLVERALEEITAEKLKKVVLSRALEVTLAQGFSPQNLFDHLCAAYPNAFVSLVALPGVGTWIGATPELLLSQQNDELTTVALAGTRPVSPGNVTGLPASHVGLEPGSERFRSGNQAWEPGDNGTFSHSEWAQKWSEKEIDEQAIVSEFIRQAFAHHKIDDYTEQRTESVRIGDLLHLQTKFKLESLASRGVNVVDTLLHSLHPTPAVCGVPQSKALTFIERHESHAREFYAGYLGPVNLGEQSHLYVNLRCLQLLQNSALLYAGGGITIDSIPVQEWLETELKLDALLKVLNGDIRPVHAVRHGEVSCYE
ncbi:MAG: chorismate-binding protein [bacterium]